MIAPAIRYSRDGKFKLVADWKVKYKDHLFIVPAGFETDLATIPRVLSPFFPRVGDNLPAAILHDYLYAEKMFSRKMADEIFNEMMKKFGVKTWRRVMMYYAVRGFGWMFYR